MLAGPRLTQPQDRRAIFNSAAHRFALLDNVVIFGLLDRGIQNSLVRIASAFIAYKFAEVLRRRMIDISDLEVSI